MGFFMKNFLEFINEMKQTKRVGIDHLNKIKPLDFIKLVKYIKDEMNGKINDTVASTTIKVDGFGCVDENTMIDTLEAGKIKIKNVPDFNVLHVKSYNFKKECEEFNKILNFQVLENNNDWYEIETHDGKKLNITGEHKVYCVNKKEWIKAEELHAGDVVSIKPN